MLIHDRLWENPVSCQNGDPPFQGPWVPIYEIGDPGPYLHIVLGTPDTLNHMNMGTPS